MNEIIRQSAFISVQTLVIPYMNNSEPLFKSMPTLFCTIQIFTLFFSCRNEFSFNQYTENYNFTNIPTTKPLTTV